MISIAQADRIGNFDIVVQPINKEESEVRGRTDYSVQKEKSQNLAYKVRIQCKSLDSEENLEVAYIVTYKSTNSGFYTSSGNQHRTTPAIKGTVSIAKLDPLGVFEFVTDSVENTYQEYQSSWSGKSQWGKAQLTGLTLRIIQKGKVLAEYATSPTVKEQWNLPESKPGRRRN